MSPTASYGGRPQNNRRRSRSTQRVGAIVPRLTKTLFQKFGFATHAVVTDWEKIVGPDLASFTRPEKLKWPRKKDELPEDSEAYDTGSQLAPGKIHAQGTDQGATLVLRVEGPRAIEIQFYGEQIMDRINAYYGYRAVTDLRILQAPLTADTKTSQKPVRRKAKPRYQGLNGIENSDLKQALAQMAGAVSGSRAS